MSVRKSAVGAMLLAMVVVSGCEQSARVKERHGLVTMRGQPLTLEGTTVGAVVGAPAPEFVAVANDMSEKRLSDFRGRTVILSTVPSLETAVCDAETRMFNERASALGDQIVVLTVSMDLPFTQKKWCGAAGIDRVVTLSDSKLRQVGDRYALRIRENGLLARAVTVIGPDGVVRYQEIVSEVTKEPDYDRAIAAAQAAAGNEASRAQRPTGSHTVALSEPNSSFSSSDK